VCAPFSSSSKRNPQKEITETPGPGAYIDIFNPSNSASCKNLKRIAEDKIIALSQGIIQPAFGSKVERGMESQKI